jgi:hypothetical protein
MKKTFPLTAPGKDDARVRDKIRHEVNKYVGRMRRQKPPTGFDFWTFSCRVGASTETAEPKPLKEVGATIDAIAAGGATEVYVEITATAEQRSFSRTL